MSRASLALLAAAIALAPIAAFAQTAPGIAGDALPGTPAVVPATSTVTGKQIKLPVTVQLCTDGTNYVACPLPSGGSNVPTGPAGSPNANVVTVQGASGGTPVPTSLSGTVPLPTGASTLAAQNTGNAALGAPGDPAATTTDTTATSIVAQLKQMVVKLSAAITAINAPTPAGTNTIGSIGNTFFGARLQDVSGSALGTTGNPIIDSTVNGALATRQGTTSPFTETTTALAASAAFTGTTVDTGAAGTNPNTVFSCHSRSAGTAGGRLAVVGSQDNFATSININSMVAPAAASSTVSAPVVARYMRCVYTNGTNAQTAFYLWSSLGAGTAGSYLNGIATVLQAQTTATGFAGASGQVVSANALASAVGVNVAGAASAGWAVLYDATAVPADGTVDATLVRWCMPIATGAAIHDQFNAPLLFTNGIVAFVSSNSCTTKAAVAYNWLGVQVR